MRDNSSYHLCYDLLCLTPMYLSLPGLHLLAVLLGLLLEACLLASGIDEESCWQVRCNRMLSTSSCTSILSYTH